MTANVATQTENRSDRMAAFREVQTILAEVRVSKLQNDEAEVIEWAAEDLLLATSADAPEVAKARTAFTTLMDDLESHRWADMVGTKEHPGRALQLRQALLACAPSA